MKVGQRFALQSSSFKVWAKEMTLGGSSSATDTRNGSLDLISPGRLDRASRVAASGWACLAPPPPPRPPVPRPPVPRPAAGVAAGGAPFGCPQGPPAPWPGGGVAGRILNPGEDMNTTPLTPTPLGP